MMPQKYSVNFSMWLMVLSVILIFSQSAFSQLPFFEEVPFTYHNAAVKTQHILKDNHGWMYFGTDQGLFRYDGISFRKVESKDSLKDENVSAIYQSISGKIWIGFRSGQIASCKKNSLELFKPEEGLPKVPVTSFTESNDSVLWFATNGEGVYCIEGGRIYNFNADDGLNDNFVHALLSDVETGKVISASDQGLNECFIKGGKKSVRKIVEDNSLPDNIITTLSKNGDDLLIGTQDRGILVVRKNGEVIIPEMSRDWQHGMVNKVITVGNENWIATNESGLVISDAHSEEYKFSIKSTTAFPHLKINDLAADNEGNVWIACSDGIVRSPGNKIRYFETIGEEKIKFIHTILYDSKGNFWFTPDQGLVKMWKDVHGKIQTQHFTITPPEKLIDIVTLYEDPYGFLWIGTMGSGIYRLQIETGKVVKLTENPALLNGSILTISGKGNVVWIGGFDGTSNCIIESASAGTEKIHFVTNPATTALGTSYIYSIYTDSKKRTWFGTDGEGAFMFDGNTVKIFKAADGLNATTIYTILEDDSGNIWLNAQDKGIFRYDGKSFENFSLQEGLSDASVSSMTFDNSGDLFLIHKNGADIFDKKTRRFTYVKNSKYLVNVNPDLNSITKNNAGDIFAGTELFILQLSPGSIRSQPYPITFIDDMSVFEKQITDSSNEFSSDQNYFTFGFTGLWYSNPSLIQYQYKMDGLNNHWINTTDRKINFPKLSPGTYTFRVRASLNNNFNDASEASYSFTINPPFWKRIWFQLLVSLIIAFLLYTFIRWRERRIRKMDRLRKESAEFQFEMLKSQVNPHFLFNSFNTLIAIIEEDKKTAVSYVEKLSEFFRSIVSYRDNKLIPLDEEIKLLGNYFYLQKKRYGQHLVLKNEIDDMKQREYEIPPLTLQLLMENAVKHNAVSKESPLLVHLYLDGNDKLVMLNNINPKMKSSTSSGLGLQNITNRFKLLTNEEVEVINDGKNFIVKIPLIKLK
jgi:ligand-binding sensor domain-containing protein